MCIRDRAVIRVKQVLRWLDITLVQVDKLCHTQSDTGIGQPNENRVLKSPYRQTDIVIGRCTEHASGENSVTGDKSVFILEFYQTHSVEMLQGTLLRGILCGKETISAI